IARGRLDRKDTATACVSPPARRDQNGSGRDDTGPARFQPTVAGHRKSLRNSFRARPALRRNVRPPRWSAREKLGRGREWDLAAKPFAVSPERRHTVRGGMRRCPAEPDRRRFEQTGLVLLSRSAGLA